MGLNKRFIGQCIKKYRKQRHLSQQMLAEMIDKSPTHVSYIENGIRSMSLETFVQIANALETPTDVLLAGQLKGSASISSQEATLLFGDCSEYEMLVIVNTVKSLKSSLRESMALLSRSSK